MSSIIYALQSMYLTSVQQHDSVSVPKVVRNTDSVVTPPSAAELVALHSYDPESPTTVSVIVRLPELVPLGGMEYRTAGG